MSLGTTKSIAPLQAEASADDGTGLRRVLTATNLTMLGIGAIIGAGIFVLTGTAAANYAGPAIVALVRHRGFGVSLRGAVLRGVRVDDPDRRQRVHICLRYARRAGCLDHRLGSDPRVSLRRGDRRGGVVRAFRRFPERPGHQSAARVHGGAARRDNWSVDGDDSIAYRGAAAAAIEALAGGIARRGDVDAAGYRHQGVGAIQQCHRVRQSRDRAAGDRLRHHVTSIPPTGTRSFRPTPECSGTSGGAACCAVRR